MLPAACGGSCLCQPPGPVSLSTTSASQAAQATAVISGEVRFKVSAIECIARPSVSHCRCVSASCSPWLGLGLGSGLGLGLGLGLGSGLGLGLGLANQQSARLGLAARDGALESTALRLQQLHVRRGRLHGG